MNEYICIHCANEITYEITARFSFGDGPYCIDCYVYLSEKAVKAVEKKAALIASIIKKRGA